MSDSPRYLQQGVEASRCGAVSGTSALRLTLPLFLIALLAASAFGLPSSNGRVAKESVLLGADHLDTSYTYTPSGSKATVTDPRGNKTTFTYDLQLLRLVGVKHPDNTQKRLHYDAHGNVDWEQDERGTCH
jgi:YD repeat-containing protein